MDAHYYDGKRDAQWTYADDGRTRWDMDVDLFNTQEWAQVETTILDGRADWQRVTIDDARRRTEVDWDLGLAVLDRQQTKFLDGRADEQTIWNDNGSRREVDWDLGGSLVYDQRIWDFAADGRQDCGWARGRDGATATYDVDLLNQATWRTQTIEYNPEGRMTRRGTVHDDGRSSWEYIGTTNRYDWAQIRQNYDARGVLGSSVGIWDTGASFNFMGTGGGGTDTYYIGLPKLITIPF